MSFSGFLLCVLAAVSLCAQAPPTPAQGKPAEQAKPGQPSVQLEVVKPEEGTLPVVPPDKVVIQIGDQKITAGQFAQIIETLPENVRGQARGGARKQLAENLIKIKVLAQEARRNKVDQDPLYKTQEAYNAENLLALFYINQYLKSARISDEELRKYYDDHKKEYEMIRARHVLVRVKGSRVPLKPDQKDLTEAEALAKAQELRKRLTTGADFAQLAKQESDDAGSGAAGGELGEFRRGQMVAEFDAVAATLPIGEVSEPVKTQYGYHIIQVESRQTKTFEDARDEIEKKLRPQLAEKLMAELRAKAGVTLDESYFGAPAPTVPK
jgi:peptidyl-prolyl cis-trans isomerase C